MTWFRRFTGYGTWHEVYAQQNENSCGIACCVMAIQRIKGIKVTGPSLYDDYDRADSEPVGTYDGSGYTYTYPLRDMLNTLDMGTWRGEELKSSEVGEAIIASMNKNRPILILTDWFLGGGHWVLVDHVHPISSNKFYAMVNDPWDAEVRPTYMNLGQTIRYLATTPKREGSGSKKRHVYAAAKRGEFGGWVIHT